MSAPATAGSDPTKALGSLLLWKEQLGYVSGTILAWGALLLSLWPVLCRLQTGAHVRALGRDEGVEVAATSYYLLALLVAVGVGMLLFGSAHIVARGFWLGHFLLETEGAGSEPSSDRVARRTYLILNVLWATSLVFLTVIGLSALASLFGRFFMSSLRWSSMLARIVASLLAFAPLYATAVYLYRRRRPEHRARIVRLAQRAGLRNIAAAYLSLLALWFLVIEFSYVADVRIPKHVFSRAAETNIVVSVELGGAVSDASSARVALRNITSGPAASEALRLTRVGRGQYVTLLPTKSLRPGAYEIALTYPHGALSSSFPFVRNQISRTAAFVLVD